MKVRIGPGLTLILVWIFPLMIPFLIPDNDLILPVSRGTDLLIVSNIILFSFFVFFFSVFGMRGSVSKIKSAIFKIDFEAYSKKINILFCLWIFVYLINVIGSGGFPLIWILTGDPRTYVDFGLPTLGGLGNLLRAYVLTSCYLIYTFSNFSPTRKRRYFFVALFLVASAFIIEVGRGNGVVLLLHPVGLYLLLNEFKLKSLIKLAMLTFVFVFSLGVIQMIRYTDGYEQLLKYAENSGFKDVGIVKLIMIPSIMYITVPVINTDLNFQASDFLKFNPYYSLQGIIPTIIRDHIFEKGDYGELINDANNVSSYYIPFIRDFGQFGAFISISLILLVVAYCYSKARQGNIHYILSYPPLFMSLVLSFFSLFFTSLVVLLYPLLVYWSLKRTLINDI